MTSFPVEPPVTPAAVNGDGESPHRRALTPEELATLPLQALLVRTGRLTLDQLSEALRENVASGHAVEDIAVARGWVSADDLAALRQAKAKHAPEQSFAPAPQVAAVPPPAPQPVAVAPPPPAPVVAPAPPPAPVAMPAPVPVEAPAALVEAPAPNAVPIGFTAPTPSATAAPATAATDNETVGVFLNLEDGERVFAGRFESREAGERHAQQLIDALMRPEPGVWPRFGNKLVRPDAVVGVEVRRRDP